jgi:hypothetical protein
VLRTKLGWLTVAEPVGATISVGHARDRKVPASVHLAPGVHEVTLHRADGSETTKPVTITAGSDSALSFESSTRGPGSPKPLPLSPEPSPTEGPWLALGWTSVGVGAAALVAMGIVGGLTLSKVSDYDATGNTDVGLFDEAVTLRTTTNVLVGVGGGFAALGIVFLIVGSTGDESAARASRSRGAQVSVRPTANGLLVQF